MQFQPHSESKLHNFIKHSHIQVHNVTDTLISFWSLSSSTGFLGFLAFFFGGPCSKVPYLSNQQILILLYSKIMLIS